MTVQPGVTVPWITGRMLTLKDCLSTLLASDGGGVPCWTGLWPGRDVAYDFCTDCDNGTCGMAWVRLDSMFPSSQFPSIDSQANQCRSPMAYRLVVGAVRCMPTVEEDGSLPDEGAILDATLAIHLDMIAMRRAIQCCFTSDEQIMLGAYEPIGPQGYCAGGQWMVTVAR